MKNKKGITLIALIITIIVLLILAGVTISLVTGDNGVLSQAQNASTNTIKSNAQFAWESAMTSIQTDYMAQATENVNLDIANVFTKGRLNSELEKNGYKLVDYNATDANKSVFGENSTNGAKFETQIQSTKTGDQNLYNAELTKKSKSSVVSEKTLELATSSGSGGGSGSGSGAGSIPELANIGDSYTYSVTLSTATGTRTINNWRVFWADEGGVYIITTDYLPVDVLNVGTEAITTKTGLTVEDDVTYKVKWANPMNIPNHINSVNSLFGAYGTLSNTFLSNYHSYTLDSNNMNSKAVSVLLNTNNWNDFATRKRC